MVKQKVMEALYNELLCECATGNPETRNFLLKAINKGKDMSDGERLAERIRVYNSYLSWYANKYAMDGVYAKSESVLNDLTSTIRCVGFGIFKDLRETEKKCGFVDNAEDYELFVYYKKNVGYLIKTLLELKVITDSQYLLLYDTHSKHWSVELCCQEAWVLECSYEEKYNEAIDAIANFKIG